MPVDAKQAKSCLAAYPAEHLRGCSELPQTRRDRPVLANIAPDWPMLRRNRNAHRSRFKLPHPDPDFGQSTRIELEPSRGADMRMLPRGISATNLRRRARAAYNQSQKQASKDTQAATNK